MFPFGADIKLKHWPIGAVLLIAANVVVFVWMQLEGRLTLDLAATDVFAGQWSVVHGEGVYPRQWPIALFVHGKTWHLLGNLFFLWTFGLLAEGRLGWWFFLPLYLAFGVGANAAEQYWMSGGEHDFTSTFGAAPALFGIMALALTWLPRNAVRCGVLWFPPQVILLPVIWFASALAVWDLMVFWKNDFPMQNVLIHLMTALLGFVVGMVLLKLHIVRGDGWDILAVTASEDRGLDSTSERVAREQQQRIEREAAARRRRDRVAAQEQLDHYLADDNPAAACTLYLKLAGTDAEPQLDGDQLQAMIAWLHGAAQWGDSLPLMQQYLHCMPEHAAATRLKMAEISLQHMARPAKALDLLAEIPRGALPPKLAQYRYRLQEQAEAMAHDADLELDD